MYDKDDSEIEPMRTTHDPLDPRTCTEDNGGQCERCIAALQHLPRKKIYSNGMEHVLGPPERTRREILGELERTLRIQMGIVQDEIGRLDDRHAAEIHEGRRQSNPGDFTK